MGYKVRIRSIQSFHLPKNFLATFIFLFYFCFEVFQSAYARLTGGEYFYQIFNVIFYGSLIVYILLHSVRKLTSTIVCYLIVTILFAVTYVVHPEYESWYLEPFYGIKPQFLYATGGIWAFAVVSLITNRDDLLRILKWCAWITFIFLSLRYLSTYIRGYWVSYDSSGSRYTSDYNLGFGYSILFPVLYFSTEAFLSNKKIYYIPFLIGCLMILTGGSRGAIIWPVAVFAFMMPYKWNVMNNRTRVISVLLILFLLPLAFIVYANYERIVQGLILFLSNKGFSSRTLMNLLSGDISDPNGRDVIYEMVIERIKEGGLFGNGVFGERVVVGRKFRWGYAHNIFLELYAAFGYIGGSIISIALIYSIIRTAKRCRRTGDQMIFITFFVSSLKLLLSDSFWFNRSFWALLAIMWLWRKRAKKDEFRKRIRDSRISN